MQDLIRQTPVQAESREQLQALLNRASGGVIFTTLQKFGEVAEPLTLRSNVVVIADEAHRSQYGLKARMDVKTGKVSYGFAKYMRDALPHASFIGFTGTPIEATDVNTPALFGNYIDIYDISRAVEDGATVPIYYESRLARIELRDDEKPTLDAEVEALFEDAGADEKESSGPRCRRGAAGGQRQAPGPGGPGFGDALRGACGRVGWQGHGGVYEPRNLRGLVQGDHQAAFGLAQRR